MPNPIVDLERSIAALARIPRGAEKWSGPGSFRDGVAAALVEVGFQLPAETAPGAAGELLLIASRYTGTVSLYQLGDGVPEALARAAEALDGSSFQRLEELPAEARAHALRLLSATRQTGLSPEEVHGWGADLGVVPLPDTDELAALEEGCAGAFRAEVSQGQPGTPTPPLQAFERVFVIGYDGN